MTRILALLALLALIFLVPAQALPLPAAPALSAKSYVLYDHTSGQVLAERDAHARLAPASLTKLMTAYIVFDTIGHGKLSLPQRLTVPAAATAHDRIESRMLLRAGQSVSVEELLQGLIVQSGNDAAITLAIAVAGSEDAFVGMMNREAARLDMNDTHFTNSVGLPDAQHYSTASDLALLATALIRDFPQHYPLFAQRDYTFNGVKQANRNRLLWLDPYADGMKTGHTETAGYCLIGSAKRGERRLISVVLGADSDSRRAGESQQLLNFGFRQFETVRLYRKDQSISTLRVWKGTENEIGLGLRRDLYVSLPTGTRPGLKARAETRQPLVAPIENGQPLGTLKLMLDGEPYAEYPLVALAAVPQANVFARGWDAIRLLFE